MFSAVVAPAVFKALSMKAAGAYLRVLFPRMFIFGFVTSSCAAMAAIFEEQPAVTIMSATIAIGFLINAFILTPLINKYRDAMIDGAAHAKAIFGRLHLVSVAVFLAQLLTSCYIVITGYLTS